MHRTMQHCKQKPSYRSFAFRLTVALLILPVIFITNAPAQSGDNAGKSNFGGRKVLYRVEPAYPADLKAANIGGYVHLNITISPAGTVSSAEVIGGNPILAQAAVHAVTAWKFAPGSSSTSGEVWFHFAP